MEISFEESVQRPFDKNNPNGYKKLVCGDDDEISITEAVAQVSMTLEQVGLFNFGKDPDYRTCFEGRDASTGDAPWARKGNEIYGWMGSWCWVPGDCVLKPGDHGLKFKDRSPGPGSAQVTPEEPEEEEEDDWRFRERPVGKGDTVVVAGDCVSSLAVQKGLYWKTVWDHPANRELKEKRKHPNILLPGDKIALLEEAPKQVPAGSEQLHRYQRVGVPAMLRLRFTLFGQPRKDLKYAVEVDGMITNRGKLDQDGALACGILPDAKEARVLLGSGTRSERFTFKLGHLPPATAVSGLQARLRNLNYYRGPINGHVEPDGKLDDPTQQAWKAFCDNNCPDAEVNDPICAITALVKAHGA